MVVRVAIFEIKSRIFVVQRSTKECVTNNPTWSHAIVFFLFPFQRKCDQYWPERGTRNYGQVHVTLKETLNMSHYTVRKLVMTHKMVSYRVLTVIHRSGGE